MALNTGKEINENTHMIILNLHSDLTLQRAVVLRKKAPVLDYNPIKNSIFSAMCA